MIILTSEGNREEVRESHHLLFLFHILPPFKNGFISLTNIVKDLPPVFKVGKLARAACNVRVAGEDMAVCDLRGAPAGAVINSQTPDFHSMRCDV